MHIYIYTYIIPSYIHTNIHTNIHAYTHTYIQTYIHSYIHACTNSPTYIHTYICKYSWYNAHSCRWIGRCAKWLVRRCCEVGGPGHQYGWSWGNQHGGRAPQWSLWPHGRHRAASQGRWRGFTAVALAQARPLLWQLCLCASTVQPIEDADSMVTCPFHQAFNSAIFTLWHAHLSLFAFCGLGLRVESLYMVQVRD